MERLAERSLVRLVSFGGGCGFCENGAGSTVAYVSNDLVSLTDATSRYHLPQKRKDRGPRVYPGGSKQQPYCPLPGTW